jgi:hypothetical protein
MLVNSSVIMVQLSHEQQRGNCSNHVRTLDKIWMLHFTAKSEIPVMERGHINLLPQKKVQTNKVKNQHNLKRQHTYVLEYSEKMR